MTATTRLTSTTQLTGRYVYAIVAGAQDEELGPFGLDGGLVYTVSDGQVAAVVSDVRKERFRPERRRLAAHHDVLKRLLNRGAVLPMSFGLIANSTQEVQKILATNHASFREQLARLQGKLEMGLRVVWDVANIFEYFVGLHAELRSLRDRLFRGGREPTQDDRIELGRLFDRALTNEREVLTEKVTAVLRRHGFDVKENRLREEREVMNLACLIPRTAQKEFEQAVFEAAHQFDNHFAFDFNGPWPPYNFVERALPV